MQARIREMSASILDDGSQGELVAQVARSEIA
jgi:hypothetical protein